jgi:hypothetical protein
VLAPASVAVPVPAWGFVVSKEDRTYLHVLNWPGTELTLEGLQSKVKSASLLKGMKLKFEQRGESLSIELPDTAKNPVDTIVVLRTAP